MGSGEDLVLDFTPSFCSVGNSGECAARGFQKCPVTCSAAFCVWAPGAFPGLPFGIILSLSPSIFLMPPWINAVQLEPARCLLAASPCPLPTQPHCHFQSLQSCASCQTQPSCPVLAWPLEAAAQSWVELSPWGVDVLGSKVNGSEAPLDPWPWRVLQITSLALTAPPLSPLSPVPCHHCPQFLPSTREKVTVLPTGSPSGATFL